MHRFFVEQNLEAGKVSIASPELAHQLRNVLKIRSGTEVALFCADAGVGWDFLFRASKVSKNGVEGTIIGKVKNDREPKFSLTLYQAVLKKDNMDWVLQKGVEVGVVKFVPVLTERAVKMRINMKRAQKIIKEAAEQSGRSLLPLIAPVTDFEAAIALAKAERGLMVLAHEKETVQKLDGLPLSSQNISLFVGPEGGFSEEELCKAQAAGCFVVSLSRRTLRAETAAITASYYLLHRFGY